MACNSHVSTRAGRRHKLDLAAASRKPQAANRKPQTANRKPQTANRKPQTANRINMRPLIKSRAGLVKFPG